MTLELSTRRLTHVLIVLLASLTSVSYQLLQITNLNLSPISCISRSTLHQSTEFSVTFCSAAADSVVPTIPPDGS